MRRGLPTGRDQAPVRCLRRAGPRSQRLPALRRAPVCCACPARGPALRFLRGRVRPSDATLGRCRDAGSAASHGAALPDLGPAIGGQQALAETGAAVGAPSLPPRAERLMPTIETTVEIAQPREVVADAFLNPANAVCWTTDLERFEIISGRPGEVGSVAHLHYNQNGRPFVMEDVLEEMIPNQYFRSRVSGGGLSAVVETWLRERRGTTEVRFRWSGSGSTFLMRLLLPFLRGTILRRARSDLDRFKDLVETHGACFQK